MPPYRGKITRSSDAEMVDVSTEYEMEPIPQDEGLVDVTQEYREETGTWDALKKGVAKGMLGLSEMGGTAAQYIGGRIGSETLQKVGQESREHVQAFSERYDPSEKIQGDIVEKPELLKSPEWWAYNIGQTGTSILPGIAVGVLSNGLIGPHLKIAGEAFQWSPKLVNALARIGTALPAGVVGGAQEGASTYEEMMKKGADEATAARGAELMTLASAALNAISFDQMLKTGTGVKGKALLNFLKRGTLAGGTEALTEYAEEPAEVAIKRTLTPDQFSEEEARKQLISGVNVMPPSFVIGLLTGGIAGNIKKQGSKPYADAVQQVTQDGTLETATDEELKNLKDNTDVLKKKRSFDKPLQEAAAKVDAEVEKRQVSPALPQDFFDQMGSFLEAGQDKAGNPFTIEQVKSFRDQYAANPKVNPASLQQLDKFIEDSEISTIARPDDEPTVLMHSLRSDLMQGLSIEEGIHRGNEIKGRHPQLSDDINKLIIEFQGRKIDQPVNREGIPSIGGTEGTLNVAPAAQIQPVATEQAAPLPTPQEAEIVAPAPAGEAVAPKTKAFDPQNDRQRNIFVSEILKSDAPEVRDLMKQAEEAWPGEDPGPVVESQIDYDLQKAPEKWLGTEAGKAILARKGWGEKAKAPASIPEPEKAPPAKPDSLSPSLRSLILMDMRTALEEGHKYGMREDDTPQQGSNVTPIGTTNPPWLMDIVRAMKKKHDKTIGKAEILAVIKKDLEGRSNTFSPRQLQIWFTVEDHLKDRANEPHYVRAQSIMEPVVDTLAQDFTEGMEQGQYRFDDLEFPPTQKEVAQAASEVVGEEHAKGNTELLKSYQAERGQADQKEDAPAAEKAKPAEEVTPKKTEKRPWQMTRDEFAETVEFGYYREKGGKDKNRRLFATYGGLRTDDIPQRNGKLTKGTEEVITDLHRREVETHAQQRRRDEASIANPYEPPGLKEGAQRRLDNNEYPSAEILAEYPDLAEKYAPKEEPKTEPTKAGTQAVIPGASESETFMLTGAPGEVGASAPTGKKQETATIEEVGEEEEKATPAKQTWQMQRKDFIKDSELSVINNEKEGPKPNKYKEGDLAIDDYGDNPYVYQLQYLDPQKIEFGLEGETRQRVISMPSTQKYIEWSKQGIEPSPITVVLQGDAKKPYSTNRRRVIAAQESGAKKIPAFVEIGRHKDIIQQALSENKPVPQAVLDEYPELKAPEPAGEGKGKTEDAGEELTYNKRNRIRGGIKWSDIEGKNAALKVKETTKQNVYPRPDYEAMVDGGMEPMVAHFVKQVYDSISAKPNVAQAPTDANLQRYIDAINRVMDGTIKWASDDKALAAWASKQVGAAKAATGTPTSISELAQGSKGLLDAVYPDGWKGYADEVRILGGNKLLRALQPGFEESKRAIKEIQKGWPGKQEAWQKRGVKVLETAKAVTINEGGRYEADSDKMTPSFSIRINDRWQGEIYDTKEEARAEVDKLKPYLVTNSRGYVVSQHDTQEEATEAARESVKKEAKKDQVSEKGISVTAAERTGPARRMEGEDISTEKLQQTFGFRGINFGNWMKGDTNEKERQLHLNHAYDSFMDLAEILNVPPKAMSLNGMLGLAFGAQGTGKHAAHFVPGVNEINLTRTAGAGAISHEWGHGLDHYFARQAGLEGRTEPFLTEHTDSRKALEGIRPEIVANFKAIVQAMRKRGITEEEQEARTRAQKETSRKNTESWIKAIRADFERQGKVDMAAFDKLADRITKLDLGEGRVSAGGKTYLSPVVAELRDLFKAAAGRVYDIGNIQALQANLDHFEYLNSERFQQREHVPQQTNTKYLNEALSLDKGKGGKKYWSTNLEMFARAFDAYVTDTLKAQAAKNTYLSGIESAPPRGTERSLTLKAQAAKNTYLSGIESAPPRGTERTAINEAFKNLISTIQTRETPRGVEMYEVRDAVRSNVSFAEQLDDFAAGKIVNRREPITVGKTPAVLEMLGAEQVPIVITQGVVEKAISKEEGRHGHGISIETLKQLPAQLADPVMVFDSATEKDSLVIMTELKQEGKTIVAAVDLSQKSGRLTVNNISTVHQRESEYHFINWINRGLLRYMNKSKSRAWSVTSGLQLPGVRGPMHGFKNKILFSHDLVKWVNENIGTEQLSVRDDHRRGALRPAKLEDVKKFFPGQEVGLDANRNIYVKTRGGKYVTIYKVSQIEADPNVLMVGYGTSKVKPGSVIPGAMGVTAEGEHYIKLHRTFADNWTLFHESFHFIETAGIVNSLDVAALRGHIKRLHREGKFETVNRKDIGGPEDRANFIADRLAVKDQRGPIGRIILRIRAFIDGILESFGVRSPESILRSIESGRIFERTGREGKGGEQYASPKNPITEEHKADLKAALKVAGQIGFTDNPRQSGWMFPDGRMVDMNDREAHLHIADKLLSHKKTDESMSTERLLAAGVTRFYFSPKDNLFIQTFRPLTEQQIKSLAGAVKESSNGIEIIYESEQHSDFSESGVALKSEAKAIAFLKEANQAFFGTARPGDQYFSVLTPDLPDFMKEYLTEKAEEVQKEYGPFAFDEKSTKNEGWFQLHPSDQFKDFRMAQEWKGIPKTEGVTYVIGTREGLREPQAVRFDKEKLTEDQAKAWWEKHKKYFATKDLWRPQAKEIPAFDAGPKKLNSWLNDETDMNVQRLMQREADLAKRGAQRLMPSNLPHNTWLENILKSPEWMEHPVISRIVRLMMRTRSELFHENFHHMTDNKVIEATKDLKGKGLNWAEVHLQGKVSKEYELFGRMMDYGDTHYKRNRKDTLDKQKKDFEKWMRATAEKQGFKKESVDDIIKVWKLHRDTYDRGLDMMTAQMRTMLGEIEERSKETGEEPSELRKTLQYHLAAMDEWKGFYAPRVRTKGSWWVWAHKGPLDSREYVMDFRGSGMAADRLAAKLKEQGWTVSRVEEAKRLPEDIYQQTKTIAVARAIEQAMADMKKGVKGQAHEDLIAKFHEELLENVSDEIKARGFRSSMIHRSTDKIVKGYKEDPLERLVIYTNNTSAGLAKSTTAKMAVNELFGELDEETGKHIGGIDPVREPRAYQTAQAYIEEQLRNMDKSDMVIGLAKSIATFKYLGFNIRSAFVNTTALATTVPPAIQQYALGGKVGFHKVMNALAVASKDYSAVMMGRKLENADEQAFMDEIKRLGYDDPQYTRDALGSIMKIQHRAWGMAMDASMYVFGKTEQWNRGTTMLAAYRLARKEGMNHDTAMEKAKTASDKAHGVYGKATLPMWAMGKNPAAKIGQMMYVYAKFSHNYLQMLYDLGFKKKNLKGLAFATLAPIVVGGMAAFPFREQIFGLFGFILKALLGEDRDPEKWVWDEIRKHYGSTAELVGRHGLTGAMGLDISSSLSIGVGVPKGLGDLAGPAGGVYEDVMEGFRFARQGQPWRAAEKFAPRALENPLKALRESREGATTRHGYRVWDEQGKPFKPDTGEAAARAFGFRGTRQAVVSERTNEAKREIRGYTERKASIYEQYRAYLAGGRSDAAVHREITRKVREFNEGLKKAGVPKEEVPRITFESMRRQAQRMRKPTKQQKAMLD